VLNSLRDLARGQNAAVEYFFLFYFGFAVRKEQSSTSALGTLIKQLVRGVEEAPEEIFPSIPRPGKNSIGMRGMGLAGIVETPQTPSSKKRTFTCLNALDEWWQDIEPSFLIH